MKSIFLLVFAATLPAHASLFHKLKSACASVLSSAAPRAADPPADFIETDGTIPVPAPRYRLAELKRTLVHRDAPAEGLTRIVLQGFPPETRVERRTAALSGEAQTDFDLPSVNSGHVSVALEILSDPRHLNHVETLLREFKFKSNGGTLKVKSREAPALVTRGTMRGEDYRFGGVGPTRALVVLPDPMTNVVIFRNGEMIHGEYGWLTLDEFIPLLKDANLDGKRANMVSRFAQTWPPRRELSANDLVRCLGTMEGDDGRLAVVRALAPRMNINERFLAHGPVARALTFGRARDEADRVLTR